MSRNILIQVLVFFVIFQMMSFLREMSMLSTSTPIESTSIQLPTIMGDTIELESNGKTTILYFFAPWCQICHVSINNLQSIYENNEQLDVIAVALDFSNLEEVVNFTEQHQLTFPIALGNSQVKTKYQITAYPSYYVLNEHNIITGRSLGYSTELGLYLRSL